MPSLVLWSVVVVLVSSLVSVMFIKMAGKASEPLIVGTVFFTWPIIMVAMIYVFIASIIGGFFMGLMGLDVKEGGSK